MEIKVREKGRITIPLKIRKSLGIKKDDVLHLYIQGNKLVLEPKDMISVKKAKGIAKHEVRLEEIEEALAFE